MATPTKAEIRRAFRELPPLPPDVRGEMSAQLCAALAAMPAWHAARTVALFAPLPSEPDVEGLWAYLAGKRAAYPRMAGETFALYAVESPYELVPAQWGIREPRPERLVSPAEVDFVVIPGVAFTRDGARCGRGKGFYDRFLAELSPAACKTGACFARQLVAELPMEPHDVRMDFVVTEAGVAG